MTPPWPLTRGPWQESRARNLPSERRVGRLLAPLSSSRNGTCTPASPGTMESRHSLKESNLLPNQGNRGRDSEENRVQNKESKATGRGQEDNPQSGRGGSPPGGSQGSKGSQGGGEGREGSEPKRGSGRSPEEGSSRSAGAGASSA